VIAGVIALQRIPVLRDVLYVLLCCITLPNSQARAHVERASKKDVQLRGASKLAAKKPKPRASGSRREELPAPADPKQPDEVQPFDQTA
jgi:hypothetical protein